MAITLGKITLVGYEDLLKNISAFPAEIQKRVDLELEAFCLAVVRGMKRRAPTNMGRLKQGTTYVKHGVMKYEIISAANYSAYMEFGTKSRFSVPAGFADYAAEYKGISIDSGGISAKTAIFLWAKQKGIPKNRWYGIYRSIMIKGVKPHPFLIPTLMEELPKLERRINKLTAAA